MSSDFLNPDEVEKLKKKKRVIVDQTDDDSNDEIDDDDISNLLEIKVPKEITANIEETPLKLQNKSGKVKIEYESMGRFDTPPVLYFSGYTVDHIDNFALVTEENIFETLVTIIEDLKYSNENVKIEDMLIEEFFETLIGIKAQFNTTKHIHRWTCDCQDDLSDKEKTVIETIVDLSTLNDSCISILESDEKYRNICREMFSDKDVFASYLKMKYGKNADINEYNLEDELNEIQVKEPYTVPDGKDIYKFRFLRIRDLIIASRYINKKYSYKIKALKSKQIHNVKASELKKIKDEELEKLNQEKGRDFIRALKSAALVGCNNKIFESLEEKIEAYQHIPIGVFMEAASFLEDIKFGINKEQDFECPICGCSEKRLLQLEFNFLEFIPNKSDTLHGIQNITRRHIFMGI